MIDKEGVYRIEAKELEVPEGMSTNDFLFNNPKDEAVLIASNHKDELVVVRRGTLINDMRYEELKPGMRKVYKGKTIFPILENEFEILESLDISPTFTTQWIVATHGDKMFFHGDKPRCEETFDGSKIVDLAVVRCKTIKGRLCHLYVVINDEKEREFVKNALKKAGNRLHVSGMNAWVNAQGQTMEKHIIASKITIEEENFDDLKTIFPKINSLNDVCVWRDLKKDTMIPSDVESAILTGALFFSYEGVAAINLIMLGSPACGKSHAMDTFAELIGTKNHNCTETTLKGLIFSHAEKGGMPGILYRERFVALLNEFVRIVGNVAAKKESVQEEVRRMLSSLNDAVEKKSGRSRSSGKVEGADATMVCSMITSDNEYPNTIGPFVNAMLEDPSYLRRYAFLRLSKETEERGGKHSKVVDWRAETKKLLYKKGIHPERWAKLMSYWRSLIPEGMTKFNLDNCQIIAKKYVDEKIDDVFFSGAMLTKENISNFKDADSLHLLLREVSMYQLAVACTVCAGIITSTFKSKKEEFPLMKNSKEAELLGKQMFERLVDDLFALMKPYIDARILESIQEEGQGVKRGRVTPW